MNDKPNNPPAFPCKKDAYSANGERCELKYSGMDLRDWFAGQALLGLLSGKALEGAVSTLGNKPSLIVNCMVGAAYEHADAMLRERGKSVI